MATRGGRRGGKGRDDETDSLDVRAALASLEPPAEDVEVSAGFFHRTLARWLGLPAGKQPARKTAAPPLWDYDFWKAELNEDAVDVEPGPGRREFTARIFRAPEGAPEVVRYWVRLDAAGRIRASGWLTAAPVLVDDGPKAFAPAPALEAGALEALYRDTD